MSGASGIINKEYIMDNDDCMLLPQAKKAVEVKDAKMVASDDESKTILTLESPKSGLQHIATSSSNHNSKPIILNNVLLKKPVINMVTTENADNLSVIAKKQLESLKHKRVVRKIVPEKSEKIHLQVTDKVKNESWTIPCSTLGRNIEKPEDDLSGLGNPTPKPRPGLKVPPPVLKSPILSSKEILNEVKDKLAKKEGITLKKITPVKSDADADGTIEIPHDMIFSNELASPMVINLNQEKQELQSHDLIAILEGDDLEIKDEHESTEYELVVEEQDDNSDEQLLEEIEISIVNKESDQSTKDRERELALKQMMNLPVKPKGRRRRNVLPSTDTNMSVLKPKDDIVQIIPISTAEAVKLETSPTKNPFIDNLVADWDDGDNSEVVYEVKELKVEGNEEPKIELVESSAVEANVVETEVPQKRRIIKKKIIWDPDNPSTTISFASLVASKRQEKKKVVVKQESTKENGATNSIPVVQKKKKMSEIDKLLGDEGAIKMMYELERENKNQDVKEVQVTSDDNEEDILHTKAKMIKNAVIKQSTSPTNVSTSRVRVKRDTTPVKSVLQARPVSKDADKKSPDNMAKEPVKKVQESVKEPIKKVNEIVKESVKKDVVVKKAQIRKRKVPGSSEWDYVYRGQQDDSMIIRRRSNSSYSSTSSPRRLSMEQPIANSGGNSEDNKNNFEFIKPGSKKCDLKLDANLVANIKGKLSKALAAKRLEPPQIDLKVVKQEKEEDHKKVSPKNKRKIEEVSPTIAQSNKKKIIEVASNSSPTISPQSTKIAPLLTIQQEVDSMDYKEIQVTRSENFFKVILNQNQEKLQDVFTITMMNELKSLLQTLKSDSTCKAVLLISNGKSFCRGVDVSTLVQSNAEKRKLAAGELSGNLRNLLQTIARFDKPIICGVQGTVSGLGVTMLPLFDIVIAHEDTTFSTPYAKIGQQPECISVLLQTHKVKANAISDLLYLCKTLNVDQAMECGLVNSISMESSFKDDLLECAQKVSSFSLQALKSIKSNLNHDFLTRLDENLLSEQKKLIQHWITVECQEKFKQYLLTEKW